MPTANFPVSILQRSVKITNEPPRAYLGFNNEILNNIYKTKPNQFKIMLFELCMYHLLILDRRKYGPLGFCESDLRVYICVQQLYEFVDMFEEIPFKQIHCLIYDINYGGTVTDNTDTRTSKIILDEFICRKILNENYKFSKSGKYYTINPTNRDGYIQYIKSLDLVPELEVFIESILPHTNSGNGKTKDEIVNETANKILKLCPSTTYSESIRYNKSFDIIKKSLKSLLCAIKAEIVMTNELEIMANSLFDNIVPDKWQSVAYRSLQNHARKRVKPMDTISFDFKLERKDGEVFSFLESEPVC
eukprot:177112_1